MIQYLDQNTPHFIKMSDFIWENPELGWKEFKASSCQADFFEKNGFTITWDIADMPTAFVAEWGEGKPVIKLSDEIVDILDSYRDKPLVGENFSALDEKLIMTGSTDVGDLSWITPVSMLFTICFTTGCTGHSWGNVSTSAHSIGDKGMMHAAKIMAVAAVDLYTDLEHLEKIKKEFGKMFRMRLRGYRTQGKPFVILGHYPLLVKKKNLTKMS